MNADHIVPIARLIKAEIDTTDPEIVGWENCNIWLIDRDLNGSKNDGIIHEWAEKRGALPHAVAMLRAIHIEATARIVKAHSAIYPQWKLTEERREILGI